MNGNCVFNFIENGALNLVDLQSKIKSLKQDG